MYFLVKVKFNCFLNLFWKPIIYVCYFSCIVFLERGMISIMSQKPWRKENILVMKLFSTHFFYKHNSIFGMGLELLIFACNFLIYFL